MSCGDTHDAKPSASNSHSNVAPVSVEENSNVALVAFVRLAGFRSMVVSGATVSTVHVACPGVGSTLSAASIARTANVCTACARPLYEAGEAQSVKGAASREHSKRAPGSLANEIDADVDATKPLGADASVVSGGVVSAAGGIVSTCVAAALPVAEAVIVGEPGCVSR